MEQALDLPTDIDSLHALVRQLLSENQHLKTQKAHLHEQIRLLLHKRFGANSEKYLAHQADLFNEAEAYADEGNLSDADQAGADNRQSNAISANHVVARPSKLGRKSLPAELPRIDIVHDLTADQKQCPEGHPLKEIGVEISEQLDIIPAKVRVLRHVRKKYACACCGNGVKIAPMPQQPIPKSNASPSLLANIATGKFLDALPLYRQSRQFERIGINLPRATLANWMVRCGELIQPLINLMQDQVNGYPVQQIDETRVQVLKEPGKQAATQSYMWVQRGGPPESQVILFTYAPSRSQTVAEQLLLGYQGFLQTDGYAAYANVCAKYGLRQLGCWAHVRRKFDEALKAQGKKPPNPNSLSHQALQMIQQLYRVEAEIKDVPQEERLRIRQERALPILTKIKVWLDRTITQATPSSLTGNALAYLAKQWPILTVYCEDGRLEIDNNAVERAIRPFVIGRRNWLFTDTVNGAKASANLYSLIETAKLNGLEPYRYLCHVFERLPKAKTLTDIEQLLTWHMGKAVMNTGWETKQAA